MSTDKNNPDIWEPVELNDILFPDNPPQKTAEELIKELDARAEQALANEREIDWTKVKKIADIVAILKELELRVDITRASDDLKKYLKD